jgi:hypothetical protein
MSVLLDTGATDSFFRELFRSVMTNRKKSSAQILIADDTKVTATDKGIVPAFVLNTAANPDVGLGTSVDLPGFVVPDMGQELISVTHFFETQGFSVHHQPQGKCEFYRISNGDCSTKETIPIRWDAVEKGFFLDIVVSNDVKMHELAAAHVLDLMDLRSSNRVSARETASLDFN